MTATYGVFIYNPKTIENMFRNMSAFVTTFFTTEKVTLKVKAEV